MKKPRKKVLRICAAVILLGIVCYNLCTSGAYWQTFGQGYSSGGNLYNTMNAYIDGAGSSRPTSYLMPDGRFLVYDRYTNSVKSNIQLVGRIPLTAMNFDVLFKGGFWTSIANDGIVNAAWLREHCVGSWLGYSIELGRLNFHYILKLKDGNLVMCTSNPLKWGSKPENVAFYRADCLVPCGNLFGFYEQAAEEIWRKVEQFWEKLQNPYL